MKLTKISTLVLGILTIFIGATFAANGEVGLSEQLVAHKDVLVTQIDTINETLTSEYNRLIGPQATTANYQSLVCLGVVEDEALLDQLAERLELLKRNMLQDYVDINADIFNLLNQYSVGLIDANTYAIQYDKLALDAQSFFENNKALLDKTNKDYLEQIFEFVNESATYSKNNSTLLSSLNDKISKIQSIMSQFTILEEGIFEINNALNLQQGNFFDTLQDTRSTVITMLRGELNQQIRRYDRKYNNNPELKITYENKRDETINSFTTNLDKKIDEIIGSRYDADEYSYVREQTEIIKARFYDEENNKEKLNCEKILATDIDLDGYVNDVEKATKSLRNDVSAGVLTLINAGTGTDHKEEILASFKDSYIINYNKELEEFKNFVRSNGVVVDTSADTNTEATAQTTVSLTITPYTFDRPFEKGEVSEGVKQLQTILTKLGYYHGQIRGKYDSATTEAVYQFQLAKGILKGVAGETAQGYVGPSTRYALNEAIKAYLKPVIIQETTVAETQTEKVTSTENPFLALILKLESRYDNKDAFVTIMQRALANLTTKLEGNITTKQKLVFENIIQAIEKYLAA